MGTLLSRADHSWLSRWPFEIALRNTYGLWKHSSHNVGVKMLALPGVVATKVNRSCERLPFQRASWMTTGDLQL